jgi:serine/threonine-protein kinase
VPDPVVSSADPELRAHVERLLTATYELDREIGRGGMGIVYKARDRRLKRPVAIKVLPPELSFRSEIRTRFLREAETAAQLSHPNIVPIFSVDERDGMVYFVMAFVDGENLAVRLHQRGSMDADEVRRILLEVARALDYAHERGVVHRDIKPDNILIQHDGRVMVTDFGIARAVTEGSDARLTATGMAIGTPAYMSPEQSMGERQIDGRSDLYSLGVVGYQMLSGELPFDAQSTPALLVKHLSERPTPVEERCPDVPRDLARAVMLCLEKDPAGRFPTAGALAVALETGEVPALPEPAAPRAPSRAAPAYQPAYQPVRPLSESERVATPEELRRWNNTRVAAFRRKLAPWMVVGVASISLNLLANFDVTPLWGFWSVFIAFQYAKLWQDGYDWRDVFKQPRDRLFFDVIAEWTDNVRALWDPKKRVEVRARARARTESLFDQGDQPPGLPPARPSSREPGRMSGASSRAISDAGRERDQILRLFNGLSRTDREEVAAVPDTAHELYRKVEGLAMNLTELERGAPPDAANEVESEIVALEAQANPLDVRASEERVKRLAYLKRQRRQLADLSSRRDRTREKMESCLLALQNLRLDLVRLQSGSQTLQHVTQVAERAMEVAREVDNALYVADEMARLDVGRAPRRRSR